MHYTTDQVEFGCFTNSIVFKENPAFADLRYGEEDSISTSTLMLANTKG